MKINLLTLLTNHNTDKYTLNISVTAIRNLLASIVLTLDECLVVYDKFRLFLLRVGVRRRENCDITERLRIGSTMASR